MKKITKDQIATRDRLASELEDIVSAMEQPLQKLESLRDEYNEKVGELKEWSGEVASDIEAYISDRSEKWQEGERGQAYMDWQTAYESFELNEWEPELEGPEFPAEVLDLFSELQEEVEA